MPHLKSIIRKFQGQLSATKSNFRLLKISFCFLSSTFCFTYLPWAVANAATLSLAWQASPGTVTGYKIHYGISSGAYTYSVDVGNNTSCSISGIETEQAYYFAATAYNEIGESDFSEEIVYRISSEPDPSVEPDPFTDPPVEPDPSTDPPVEPDPSTDPLDEIIIDNGDESTFFTGTWKISRYSSPYGNDSLFSRDNGSRYSFEAALSGSYVVSLCWNKHRRSCSRVPVEIYDGNTRIAIVEVNQQRDGGQWNELGEYSFNGTARVAVVSKGGCITGVDAVEFASNDAPAPIIYQITASAGSGGSISPAGEVTVSSGSSVSYTIQPDADYHIADVKVDGTSVGPVTSYTFKDVSYDHNITSSFEADTTPPDSGRSRGWRRWWRRR